MDKMKELTERVNEIIRTEDVSEDFVTEFSRLVEDFIGNLPLEDKAHFSSVASSISNEENGINEILDVLIELDDDDFIALLIVIGSMVLSIIPLLQKMSSDEA